MQAVVITEFGGPEVLKYQTVPDPAPQEGQVLIDVKARGLNRAETYFRKGAWGQDVARISGIECVGIVRSDPAGRFAPGTKVIALMGGMGRDINGSYGEMVSVPAESVVAVQSELSWEDLAAIPESYATAWACLNRNLDVQAGQTLLIRGATSALGRAAMNLAVDMGAKVIGTTRNPEKFGTIAEHGAIPVQDAPDLSERIRADNGPIDAVLEIVGNSTLIDSLAMLRHDGRLCLAGFLGGPEPVEGFDPLIHMPSGVQFSFFGSAFVFATPAFPLDQIPFQSIIQAIEQGRYNARPSRVFALEEMARAHELMEADGADGKLVATTS